MAYLVQISVLLCLAAQIVRGEDCMDQNILSSGYEGSTALQLGLVTLNNKNDGLRYQIYRVNHDPNIKFYYDQKTIGLNILYMTGYLDKTGLDYSVRPIPFDSHFDIMLVMNSRARWISVTVQYVISSHMYFVTGFFQVPNIELLYPTLNESRQIAFENKARNLDRRLLDFNTNQVNIFFSICGIKYEQLDLQIQLLPSKYQITTTGASDIVFSGVLKFSNTTQPIQLLYLSYFVSGKRQTTGLLFFDIPPNYLGTSFNSTKKKMDFKQNYLAGITIINGTALKKFFDISSRPLKYVNSAKPTISSPSPVTTAIPAGKLNATKRLLLNPDLPHRTRSVNSQVPRAVVTRLETQGSISLAEFGVDDTIQLDQLIQELSSNYQPYEGMTQAQVEAYGSSFRVSQFARFRHQISGTISRLGTQTYLDTTRKILNANWKVCVPIKTCQQLLGKPIASSNKKYFCKLCGDNQRYSQEQDKCVCIKGFVLKGTDCISPQSFCEKGQRYENGNCVSIQSSQIVCNNKNGYILNTQKTSCECKSGLKQWVSKTGDKKCIVPCNGDLVYSQVSEQCKCPQGKTQSQGKCYQCPNGKKWNPAQNKCVCIGNAIQLDSGVCLICSTFGKFNSATSQCQCLPGYSGNGIVCKAATTFPTFSPRTQLSTNDLLPKRLGFGSNP